MKKIAQTSLLIFLVLGLSACSEQKPPADTTMPSGNPSAEVHTPVPLPPAADRGQDSSTVMRGARLYQDNCAACHGAQAQGAPNWQRKGPDGKLPPPPLDASGHAWHHPGTWIRDMIRQGTVNRGGNMPSWEGKLSDADIDAVIAWIQSRWPGEIYDSWRTMDEKSRQGAKR